MSDHIEVHYGNLPAGEDTNLVLGSVFQYGLCATASRPARNNTDRYSVLFMRKQGKAVPRVKRA
jgi:hypothetical protein